MLLRRLKIQNFKRIKDFTLEADGKNVRILGKNGTGKSSVFDAYSWVLLGKGAEGNQVDSQIKLRDNSGNTPNDGGIDHFVEAEFQKDNGEHFTLKKVFVEKWEKKRGQPQSEFTGHTTNYFVNGVPCSKTEFTKFVAEIGSEDAFKLLSMPFHFCTNLHWKDRRKILLAICGDILDEEVIDSNEKLKDLKQIIGSNSIEDARKILAAKRKEINKELERIPARIDELTRITSNEEDLGNKEVLEIEIESLKKQQNDLRSKIVRLENGGEVAEKKKSIAEIDAKIIALKGRIEAEREAKVSDNRHKLNELKHEKATLQRESDELKKRMSILKGCCEMTTKQMDKLRDDYNIKKSEEFKVSIDTTCPTCGQSLPEEKIEVARKKAEEEFLLLRSTKLKSIQTEGKDLKVKHDQDLASYEEFSAKLLQKENRINELESTIQDVTALVDEVPFTDLSTSPEYIRLDTEKKNVMKSIEQIFDSVDVEIRNVNQEIAILDTDIQSRNEKILKLNNLADTQKRIKELQDEEVSLGEQFSKLEKDLYLTEEFIRSKVSLLEEKINSKFKNVKFKMFNQKINGGLEECCDVLLDGVPFSDGLNKGGCMNAALDVLNVLSEYYGLNLPVFIDNCESYTSLLPIESQVIMLEANKEFSELHVEVQ